MLVAHEFFDAVPVYVIKACSLPLSHHTVTARLVAAHRKRRRGGTKSASHPQTIRASATPVRPRPSSNVEPQRYPGDGVGDRSIVMRYVPLSALFHFISIFDQLSSFLSCFVAISSVIVVFLTLF